jgi:hypothetical protein
MGTGSQRRRNVTKRFAAGGAVLRVDHFGAEPVASGFTMRIHTLNGGARHEGHNALSPWQPAHAWVVSFPWRPSSFLGGTITWAELSRRVHEESMGNEV